MDNEWKFLKEVHSFGDLPDDLIPEFIFWGRIKCWEITLINLLTKSQIAKTSRLLCKNHLFFFNIKKTFRIIDLLWVMDFLKFPKYIYIKLINFKRISNKKNKFKKNFYFSRF